VVHLKKGGSLHISLLFCHLHHVTLSQPQHACHFTFAYIVLHKTRNSSSFLHFSHIFMCCTMCCMCCISLELRITTSVSCAARQRPNFLRRLTKIRRSALRKIRKPALHPLWRSFVASFSSILHDIFILSLIVALHFSLFALSFSRKVETLHLLISLTTRGRPKASQASPASEYR